MTGDDPVMPVIGEGIEEEVEGREAKRPGAKLVRPRPRPIAPERPNPFLPPPFGGRVPVPLLGPFVDPGSCPKPS